MRVRYHKTERVLRRNKWLPCVVPLTGGAQYDGPTQDGVGPFLNTSDYAINGRCEMIQSRVHPHSAAGIAQLEPKSRRLL